MTIRCAYCGRRIWPGQRRGWFVAAKTLHWHGACWRGDHD